MNILKHLNNTVVGVFCCCIASCNDTAVSGHLTGHIVYVSVLRKLCARVPQFPEFTADAVWRDEGQR